MPDEASLRSTKGYPPSSLCHHWSPHWASDGGSEGMASHDLSEVKHFETPSSLGSTASLPKPERRMLGWTNGLPGATKRLGAMMAQRGLSASQPRMRADTHVGPELNAPLQRPDTLMQLSRSSLLEFRLVQRGRAIHTSWHHQRTLDAHLDCRDRHEVRCGSSQ